jgi:hypothetical protein
MNVKYWLLLINKLFLKNLSDKLKLVVCSYYAD